MKSVPDLPVEFLIGGNLSSMQCVPLPVYSDAAVCFLRDWSRELLSLTEARTHPDVVSFAYWCRPANLARLKRELTDQHRRLGRGLAVHIAPSNVPVNFAFSFAFGLLSGNANIVRVPESLPVQAELLCNVAAKVLSFPEHSRVSAMSRLIRYPRNDAITRTLSAIADVRLLWGGDQTIHHLRAMPSPPRCVDISFADRYSLCLLSAEAIIKTDEKSLHTLALGFYNDVFLLDQGACSSPHLILWQGEEVDIITAQGRFWQAVQSVLNTKPIVPSIHAMNKYVHLCSTAIKLDDVRLQAQMNNQIYRVSLKELPPNIADFRGRHGFFFETSDSCLDQLQRIVEGRYQTLTFFGVDADQIIDTILTLGLPGIDRVVPVGKALDIGVVWDGYDLIRSMSRIVATR